MEKMRTSRFRWLACFNFVFCLNPNFLLVMAVRDYNDISIHSTNRFVSLPVWGKFYE